MKVLKLNVLRKTKIQLQSYSIVFLFKYVMICLVIYREAMKIVKISKRYCHKVQEIQLTQIFQFLHLNNGQSLTFDHLSFIQNYQTGNNNLLNIINARIQREN
ncbi:unnamed protein product [Paramecium primaurelia]|uniref:Transmembrane protein n=1 Tax=Paramecium primaurelia TaxID=5886 RepID=A0A8S1KF56_PARPR|nr:unnamed protein product [Paramecium primaurelia]